MKPTTKQMKKILEKAIGSLIGSYGVHLENENGERVTNESDITLALTFNKETNEIEVKDILWERVHFRFKLTSVQVEKE